VAGGRAGGRAELRTHTLLVEAVQPETRLGRRPRGALARDLADGLQCVGEDSVCGGQPALPRRTAENGFGGNGSCGRGTRAHRRNQTSVYCTQGSTREGEEQTDFAETVLVFGAGGRHVRPLDAGVGGQRLGSPHSRGARAATRSRAEQLPRGAATTRGDVACSARARIARQ